MAAKLCSSVLQSGPVHVAFTSIFFRAVAPFFEIAGQNESGVVLRMEISRYEMSSLW